MLASYWPLIKNIPVNSGFIMYTETEYTCPFYHHTVHWDNIQYLSVHLSYWPLRQSKPVSFGVIKFTETGFILSSETEYTCQWDRILVNYGATLSTWDSMYLSITVSHCPPEIEYTCLFWPHTVYLRQNIPVYSGIKLSTCDRIYNPVLTSAARAWKLWETERDISL